MEKRNGYVPQNTDVNIVPLRVFEKYNTPVLVFPSKGKPFAALFMSKKETLQKDNPATYLWAEGGQIIFGGGTKACKLESLEKFPHLEKEINAHNPEYKPKSYRYTKEAEARFLKKKYGIIRSPSEKK